MSRKVTARKRSIKHIAPGLFKVQGLGANWAVKVDETRVDIGGLWFFTISLLGKQTASAHDCWLLRGDRSRVPARLIEVSRAKIVVTEVLQK